MFMFLRGMKNIPLDFLAWLGEPYKMEIESNLRGQSEDHLRREYERGKSSHYGERVLLSCICIFLSFVLVIGVWVSGGYLLWLIPMLVLAAALVDGFMALCRYIYAQKKIEEAQGKNELVVAGFWQDDTLKKILDKRAADREAFRKSYVERTGREPADYDYR